MPHRTSRTPATRPRPAARALRTTLGVALAAAAAALSCDGSAPTDVRPLVAAVSITPPSAQLAVGATMQFTAVARADDGTELTGRQLFWASGDTTIAVVSAAGVVTARRVGVVPVQAVVDDTAAVAFVNVGAAPAAPVVVTPATSSVAVGATTQLAASVRDATGAALPDRIVMWRSSNDAVARVTSMGLVSGVAPGAATITATSEAASGTAAVTVAAAGGGGAVVTRVTVAPASLDLEVGDRKRLTATAYDAANRAVTTATCTWASNSTEHATVAAVAATTADVTARKATNKGPVIPNNTLRITATCGAQAGSAVVEIE